MALESVLSNIDETLPKAVERLLAFLRIPSISTDPSFKADCDRAADWLVDELTSLGFEATKRPTAGQPMVIARKRGPGRHLVFYGHYDVQPVDPLKLWDRDPFDPELQEGPNGKLIRARGVGDDKGQLMTFIEACRAWKEVHGELPGNLTLFFEGEEESGSLSLVPFMQQNAEELKGDLALICDTNLFQSTTPAIVTMLRGILGEAVTIRAASRDLHSGMYGGVAMNPIRVLSKIVASMHDESGRITVPGFYDGVDELPKVVSDQWRELAFDHAKFLGDVGLSVPAGEQDRTPLEMIWSRPTCDVNGMWGGYTGDGFKTVLPAKASTKISFRLVGRQDPKAVQASLKDYLEANIHPDCRLEFKALHGAGATVMPTDDPLFGKAKAALSDEWENDAVFVGGGGSIPVVGHFRDILGTDSVLIGFGLDDDNLHSPNEKYNLSSFHKGIRSWVRILDAIYSA